MLTIIPITHLHIKNQKSKQNDLATVMPYGFSRNEFRPQWTRVISVDVHYVKFNVKNNEVLIVKLALCDVTKF